MIRLDLSTELKGSTSIMLRDDGGEFLGELRLNKSTLGFRKPFTHQFERIHYERLPYIFKIHGRRTKKMDG